MATAYENLVKHLKLAIRQLDILDKDCADLDHLQLYDLVDRIQFLALDLTAPSTPQ